MVHDIIIVDAAGTLVADFKIEHTAAGWRQWKEKISAYPKLGVAIETSFGMVVEQIIDRAATVYPVNPMSARRYRERSRGPWRGAETDSRRLPAGQMRREAAQLSTIPAAPRPTAMMPGRCSAHRWSRLACAWPERPHDRRAAHLVPR